MSLFSEWGHRMARDHKEIKPTDSYNYETLERALYPKQGQSYKTVRPYSPYHNSQFQIGTNNGYYFLNNKDFKDPKNPNPKMVPTGVKLHFNFGSDEEQLMKAWNALIPVFLSFPDLVGQVKVIIPKYTKQLDEGLKKQLDVYSNYVKNLQVEEKENHALKLLNKDIVESKLAFESESKRRLESTQVTLYILTDKNNPNAYGDKYKDFIKKADEALQKANIPESKEFSDTDFKAMGSKYISLRCDTDSLGDINIFQARRKDVWDSFKNNPLIKTFVNSDDLKKEAPTFIPEPCYRRRLELGRKFDKSTVETCVDMLRSENFLNTFKTWEAESKDKMCTEGISEIKKTLESKILPADFIFFSILSICEKVFDDVKRRTYTPGLFTNPNPINQSSLMFSFFETMSNRKISDLNKNLAEIEKSLTKSSNVLSSGGG